MVKKIRFVLPLLVVFSMLPLAPPKALASKVSIVDVVQTPWIVDDGGVLKSETKLFIENGNDARADAWVKIAVEGKAPYMQEIPALTEGRNEVSVYVAELEQDGDEVTFELYFNRHGQGAPHASLTVEQKKIRHWKVYVAHDMHLDIGYTHGQEELLEDVWPGYLDDALGYVEETEGREPNDRFRYPIEASYMLYDSAWNARDADWFETVKARLREGTLTYPSNYVNTVYGGLGTEELARMQYYSERHLKDRLGVASNKVLYMSDSPGMSWAAIDAFAASGVRYAMLRQNPYPLEPYPELFYYEGLNPDNRILTYNYGHYATDEFDFRNPDPLVPAANITDNLMRYHRGDYPYDAVIADFTTPYDNQGITAAVKDNIAFLNSKTDAQGRKYVYPQFVSSTVDDFFSYMSERYSDDIPVFQGTMEDWWNYGVSSTAYETALNKQNHDKLPAAELYATLANALVDGAKYPYRELADAYRNMILYDEHTWGNEIPQPDDQWRWKRNTAIASDTLANRVLDRSLESISTQIAASGKSVAVYNALSWERSDVVTMSGDGFPDRFQLVDQETGQPVKYRKTDDGSIVFVASGVPGLGYKTFAIEESASEPQFESSIVATDDTLENRFYKITFDDTGAISSIVDKQHGNREMVDPASPYRLNEFVYFTTKKMSHDVYTEHTVPKAELSGDAGPVLGTMTADGVSVGVKEMRRQVILYEDLPRIDIVNDVVKEDAPSYATQDEEGFFTFPLRVPNFMLRHEMPSGDMRPYVRTDITHPDNEQFLSSSTAYYTVNRWIDASDQEGYGITLSPISNPIVQYGERRSALGPWDYNTENPWIYSFVFNNKWHVNFQKTQPGPVTLRYSIASHAGGDWESGRADRFGMQANHALRGVMIDDAQPEGTLRASAGQFMSIDRDNVVLTTAKLAEANGEGVILRFNETLGEDTMVTVDLNALAPAQVIRTDMVENDIEPIDLVEGRFVTFEIEGHDWVTMRVVHGRPPEQVQGVSAVSSANGTHVTWNDLADERLSHYEVFRGTSADFVPGPGDYVASVTSNGYYDHQVASDMEHDYYYRVRAVKSGAKGGYSDAAEAREGVITDTESPSVPAALHAFAQNHSRVSLSWLPSSDNVRLQGYKIYRNGEPIADLKANFTSYLDTGLQGGRTYTYAVAAYDGFGNESASGDAVNVRTFPLEISGGNVAPLAVATASSEYNAEYGAAKTIDGVAGVHGAGEWASNGELNPWIQLDWESDVTIRSIKLYDRQNLQDNSVTASVYFSDGTHIPVEGIPADGAFKEIDFDTKTVRWLKVQVTGGSGANVGLSEIEVFQEGGNTGAFVTASSEFNEDYGAAKAADGVIGVHGRGEWASNGERLPWIRLEWPGLKLINEVVIYDRVNLQDHASEGTITFGDGSAIDVSDIPNDGQGKSVAFPSKAVSWMKFQVTEGSGTHVGLSELRMIEAVNRAREATITGSSQFNDHYGVTRAADGVVGFHDNGEWASSGESNPWIQLQWDEAVTIDRIRLYDRINLADNALSGVLRFSDGSSITVEGIPEDGTVKEIVFDRKTVEWVKFEVTGGAGSNVGLSEIEIF
ncbi:DUF7402 domain-containing protein [Paenibacillus antri]|nr:discoidin domain-containing protein [Paenibacillus antri]